MRRATRVLQPRRCKYPAPAVDGGQITLEADDLCALLSDLLAVNPQLASSRWTLHTLFSNSAIKQGESLSCCRIVQLPTTKWNISFHPDHYILVSGRKNQPAFAKYHRGTVCCRTAPASPGWKARTSTSPPPPPRSPRVQRGAKSPLHGGDFECGPSPPPSPASFLGNQPYEVALHKWAALAVEPSPQPPPVGLHVCGHPNCICIAHLQLGTPAENTQDTSWHKGHPRRASRAYPPR